MKHFIYFIAAVLGLAVAVPTDEDFKALETRVATLEAQGAALAERVKKLEESPPAPVSRLLQAEDLTYLGAFKLPIGKHGASEFNYGAMAMEFHPANQSLFVTDSGTSIAEIKIPEIKSGPLNTLATATVLQPFVHIVPRLPLWPLEGSVKIGGVMLVNGELVGTIYEYYDGDTDAAFSHFKLAGTNLAASPASGMFALTFEAGSVAGWMCPVPAEWQERIGGPCLTGKGCIPIATRTSWGPAAIVFDPAQLGATPAPATPLVHYNSKNNLGPIDGPPNPYWNGATNIQGIAWPDGSDSILFFGDHGMGECKYGEGTADSTLVGKPTPGGSVYVYDPHRRGLKGYHAWPYRFQVWAYNAADLAAVKAGAKQRWEVKPYATWEIPGLYNHQISEEGVIASPGQSLLGGTAWDAAGRVLYVVEQRAGGKFGMPVIHAINVR